MFETYAIVLFCVQCKQGRSTLCNASKAGRQGRLCISYYAYIMISYLFIKGTALLASHFDGTLWPGRFIGQSSGIVVFAIMTFVLMNEGINTKTAISLLLAVLLISVQIFWK